jgi:hypothetical protein
VVELGSVFRTQFLLQVSELTSETLRNIYIQTKNMEGGEMNERIIKIAHIVAIALCLLAAIVAVAAQEVQTVQKTLIPNDAILSAG